MNKLKIFTTIILLFSVFAVFAQTSQRGFSFQGYAVGTSGVVLSEEHLDVKFTIYPKSGVGYTYEETQYIITDFYGVFSAEIGSETPEMFQRLNFTAKGVEYWLKVEVKKITEPLFNIISDQALLAVPYAKFAENGVPVGTIISFAAGATKVPEGWLLCDGSEYDGTNAQYEQLYTVIANTWGGTGTNFNVPDLRGYFLRGVDDAAGNDDDAASRTALIAGGATGDNVGSYQLDGVGDHKHTYSGSTSSGGSHSHNVNAYYGGGVVSSGSDVVIYNPDGSSAGYAGYTSADGDHAHSFSGTTAVNAGDETRPKNAYVLYIIKY